MTKLSRRGNGRINSKIKQTQTHLTTWGQNAKLKQTSIENTMKLLKTALLSTLLTASLYAHANLSVNQSTDGIVAKVNDEVILKSELTGAMEELAQGYLANGIPADMKQIQNQAMEQLIIRKIQLGMVRRAGFSVNDAIINRQIAQLAQAQGFNSLESFQQFLDKQSPDGYAKLRQDMIDDASLTALWQSQVSPRIKINEQEIDAFLNSPEGAKIPNEQVLLPEWRTSHILARVDDTQSDSMASQKINAIYTQLQQGADFKALASTYSDDTGSALQQGSLGWVSEGQMVAEFEQVMQNTIRGDFSTPFRSQFGWHILKIDDTRQRDVTQEYRRNLAKEALFARMAPQAEEDWILELRSGAYIKIMD